MRYVVATLVLAGLAVLQVSLFSRVSAWGATPQVLLLGVLAWSLVRGPGEGMFWGFCGGLLYDLVSHGPVGVAALAMVLAASLAGIGARTLFSSNLLFPLLLVFISTVLYVIVTAFLLATLHLPTDWQATVSDVAIPMAAANAVLALVVCPASALINAHTDGQLRVKI